MRDIIRIYRMFSSRTYRKEYVCKLSIGGKFRKGLERNTSRSWSGVSRNFKIQDGKLNRNDDITLISCQGGLINEAPAATYRQSVKSRHPSNSLKKYPSCEFIRNTRRFPTKINANKSGSGIAPGTLRIYSGSQMLA
jgi:hypothetical protein